MSRFEASGSPVDILVFRCSGLPGGPKSNGLIFIVSVGSHRRTPDTALTGGGAHHTLPHGTGGVSQGTGARTRHVWAGGGGPAAEMLTNNIFIY